jgi:hypothetical protein
VPSDPRHTGICVIRVEMCRDDLLITLRMNRDIEHIAVEQVHHYADVASAILAIREFLDAFIATSRRRCPF